jgi:hypothetical protein
MKVSHLLLSLALMPLGSLSAMAGQKACQCVAVIDKDDPFDVATSGTNVPQNLDFATFQVRYTTAPACERQTGNCPKPTITWKWVISSKDGVSIDGADDKETVKVVASTGPSKEFTLSVTVNLECKTSVGLPAEGGGATVTADRKHSYDATDTLYLGK